MNVFFALLIAAALMPFIWNPIKKRLRLAAPVVTALSILLDIVLAAVVLWIFGMFSLLNWLGAAIIVFVVSRTIYDHVIKRFFPNRGSV